MTIATTATTLVCALAASGLLAVGCLKTADQPPSPDAASVSTNAVCVAKPTTTSPAKVPIVYSHFGDHQQLSAEQRRIILDVCVRWQKPVDCRLWFVAVHYIGKYSVWAEAYYEPDVASPRLRKGRSTRIQMSKESELVEVPDERGRRRLEYRFGDNERLDVNRPSTYVQVSKPDMPFTDELKVPARADLPFPPPAYPPALTGDGNVRELSDDDLVALVDFVRARWAELDQPQIDQNDPVCWIVGNGDDVFGVARGVSEWGGEAVHVRTNNGAHEIVGNTAWVDSDTVAWPPPRQK